jgi:hypothetical protein
MYLWKIERTDDVDWDEARALIVMAPYASRALSFVIAHAPGTQRGSCWEVATITAVGEALPGPDGRELTEPAIILADVRSG